MKRKVLFVMTSLKTGGISTSIINLLQELVKNSDLDLSLLLFDTNSICTNQLPPQIKILDSGSLGPKIVALSQSETNSISLTLGLKRLAVGFISKCIGQKIAYRILFRTIKISMKWDYAISCTQSAPYHRLYGGCNEFVLKKITATHKIAFIHCDYIRYGINNRYNHFIYKEFDKIATVSESVKRQFLRCEPDFRTKTVVVTNCHNYKSIQSLSKKDPVLYDKTVFNVITVARLCTEKGHFRFLDVLKQLTEKGYKIHWHILGDCNDDYLKRFIVECNIKHLKNVSLYGNQSNPYRYMLNADLLVVPSFHEAAPMVYFEAATLNLPILSTETLSAKEVLEKNHIGYVCKNSIDGLYNGMIDILDDLDSFNNKRKEHLPLNNNKPLKEFYSLFD